MTADVIPDADDVDAERARLRDALRRAFVAESATRQRGPHDLGLSAIGGCTRRAAYMAAGAAPSDTPDTREGRAANLGTYEHAGLLPRLAAELPGAQIEVTVHLRAAGMAIPGHIDLDDPRTVVDLKTVGEHKLQAVRRAGLPYLSHLIQVCAYATALMQSGRTPVYVAVLYLDRASGEDEVMVLPFTTALALLAIERVEEIVDHADNADAAPREDAAGDRLRGPGRSYDCAECHFLRRCWGPFATPDAYDRDYGPSYDDDEVAALLAAYADAHQRYAAAKKVKDDIAAELDRVNYGTYGDYRYRRDRDGQTVDEQAMARLLEALGYPLPMKARRGSLRVTRINAATPDTTPGRRRRSRSAKPDEQPSPNPPPSS